MPAFRTPVDIANSALQQLRRPAIYSFADTSVEAHETASNYDQLRLAELRRACWRFSTKRVILRPIQNTTQTIVPAAWDIAADYLAGDIVNYADQYWCATMAHNGQKPGTVPDSGRLYWESYYGPLTVDVWQSPINPAASTSPGNLSPTSYFIGELVYIVDDTGAPTIYRSLISNNTNDPTAVDEWIDDQLYTTDQVVSYNGTNYQSVTDLNFNNPPDSTVQWTATVSSPLVSNSWREVDADLTSVNIVYPLGAGPASDTRTRNCYRLPSGFLRQAPTDPKAGINPFLGAPTGNMMTDWLFESDYIVSRNAEPIMLRFVADVQSVPEFDSMFSVALAARMATDLAPRLADAEHLATIISDAREGYFRTIAEARTVNGIETGPIDAVEDDYVTCRL